MGVKMRRWCCTSIIAMMMLLGGCASSVVRSEVTVFHEWPGDAGSKAYAFEHSAEQNNDLEYRNYENLVREQLRRLGFTEPAAAAAHLKVKLSYGVRGRDVTVVQSTPPDSFWYNSPLYGHRWRGRGYYGPYYDPVFPLEPSGGVVATTYETYLRQLRVTIAELKSGKKLYDVTVNSDGTNSSLPAVMPYMVTSAFSVFPGASGVPRVVSLRMQD
jgi:hypothetical protein